MITWLLHPLLILPADTRSINRCAGRTECLQNHLRTGKITDRSQIRVSGWSLDRCHAYLLDGGNISLLLHLQNTRAYPHSYTKTIFPAGDLPDIADEPRASHRHAYLRGRPCSLGRPLSSASTTPTPANESSMSVREPPNNLQVRRTEHCPSSRRNDSTGKNERRLHDYSFRPETGHPRPHVMTGEASRREPLLRSQHIRQVADLQAVQTRASTHRALPSSHRRANQRCSSCVYCG